MTTLFRTALLLTLVLCAAQIAPAQQPFTGIIEYKFVQFEEDSQAPDKVWVYHSREKVKMVMREKATGRKNWIMVNLQNDSLYIFDEADNSLARYPVAFGTVMSVSPEKTDSATNLFGYNCRMYKWKAGFGERDIWSWNAEQLPSVLARYEEPNLMLIVMGQKNIMLGFSLFKNGTREGAMIAETLTPMNQLPDSLFQLQGQMKQLRDVLESIEMQDASERADSLIKAVAEPDILTDKPKPEVKPRKRPTRPGSNKKKKNTAALRPEHYFLKSTSRFGIPV